MSAQRASASASETRDPRVAALSARIREIEATDDARFGSFGTGDWILCVAFSVVLPVLAVWWFA